MHSLFGVGPASRTDVPSHGFPICFTLCRSTFNAPSVSFEFEHCGNLGGRPHRDLPATKHRSRQFFPLPIIELTKDPFVGRAVSRNSGRVYGATLIAPSSHRT